MSNFDLSNDSVPQLIQGMMFATVIGLEALGRSGSNAEIDDKVASGPRKPSKGKKRYLPEAALNRSAGLDAQWSERTL